MKEELKQLIEWMDTYLDHGVSEEYKRQPLAQDWARVTKVAEEAGEAVDALIGMTGQNPRKGTYGSIQDLYAELADVVLTGMYAIEHFTKNPEQTVQIVMDRARYHKSRVYDG